MNSPLQLALALADACLAREASARGLMKSMRWVLGKKWPWVPALCTKIHQQAGPNFYHYTRHELAAIILADHGFTHAWKRTSVDNGASTVPKIKHYCLDVPIAPQPAPWLAALNLPQLTSSGALATWLQLPPGELAWYADQWRGAAQDSPQFQPQLQHYRYRWLSKPSGGMRLIEMPKLRLRKIQRQILRQILDRVPPHPAAHGFRPAHSCMTHAQLHCGQRVVLRMDLKDFFASIPAARIHALFAKLGYPDTVARLLARLCTHRTPGQVLHPMPGPSGQADQQENNKLTQLRSRHLPQGAPSSPALSNLCAFRLDIRLAGLAKSLNASYSRYADDLTFSGGRQLETALRQLVPQIGAIALEEGFTINFRKTRIMRQAQRQLVTGMVVNTKPNIKRAEFDRLKAILTNCIRYGPQAQNRQQHPDFQAFLRGKVAWVKMINPARGAHLAALFEQITWPAD
jgi:RNA-directed DNA polymerase